MNRFSSRSGFTIVEILVSILIFTIGLVSAYLLIDSSLSLVVQSKNEIIRGNIIREQIEILKNIRDTNWLQYRKWNKLNGYFSDYGSVKTSGDVFLEPGFYIVENDFSDSLKFPSIITKIDENSFHGSKNEILSSTSPVRLCIDEKGRYTHLRCGSSTSRFVPFYSFLEIKRLTTKDEKNNKVLWVPQAFLVKSVAIGIERGYREYSVQTIITDWRK